MIYSTVTDTIEKLLNEEASPEKMMQFVTSKDEDSGEAVAALTICLLSIGNISLSDIERFTIVTDKHVHCFICEVREEFVDIYKEELGGNTFMSPATVRYKDELYTVIIMQNLYTVRMTNPSAVHVTICKLYELMTYEYSNYIDLMISDEFDNQNMAAACNEYATLYIPIGICKRLDIPIEDKYTRLTSVQSFFKVLEEEKQFWCIRLFDSNGITIYNDDKYPELCYLNSVDDEDEDYQDGIN